MNPVPLVSIIIPCYNAGRWLAQTLESALAQTHPSIEIIVVDDGSSDNSLAIARSFEPRGVCVVAQANSGASAARNHGLRLARGEFILFLDADDLLSPDAVARQATALEGKPDHIAFGAWARFHDDPAAAVFTPHPGWHDSPALDWIKETWRDTEPMYQCGNFLIPRPLLNRAGGWDERLSLIDDFEFFTRLILASTGLVFISEARLYYRSSLPGSLSGRKGRKACESAVLSTQRAVDHLLAQEDTPSTRCLGANMLQKQVFTFYPEHADLRRSLLTRIRELGGSVLSPSGGPVFLFIVRLTGWRFASRLRYLLGRRPV